MRAVVAETSIQDEYEIVLAATVRHRLKNQLDMKRLRVHTSAAMDSRILLQFLALILISAIRKTAKNTDTIKDMTVREIMKTLVRIKHEHHCGCLYTETTPLQRKIMEAFDCTIQTK